MATVNVDPINLDQSYPQNYSSHPEDSMDYKRGAVRFIGEDDTNALGAFTRFAGDILNRFRLIEAHINMLVTAWKSNPKLGAFDNSGYILADGSHKFTAPIAGVSPRTGEGGALDLVTRSHMDEAVSSIEERLGILEGSNEEDSSINESLTYKSSWITVPWQASVKQVLSFELEPTTPELNLDKLISLSVIQKLDISSEGASKYIYRVLASSGTRYGYTVDDVWVEPPNTVKIAIPNASLYPTGYSTATGYQSTTTFRTNQLRAVILTEK